MPESQICTTKLFLRCFLNFTFFFTKPCWPMSLESMRYRFANEIEFFFESVNIAVSPIFMNAQHIETMSHADSKYLHLNSILFSNQKPRLKILEMVSDHWKQTLTRVARNILLTKQCAWQHTQQSELFLFYKVTQNRIFQTRREERVMWTEWCVCLDIGHPLSSMAACVFVICMLSRCMHSS